jgi:peptidoglycan/LPS O-acetylase OafA/YrhL
MSYDFTKSKASVLLDLVRGLAALLVLVEHWRNIFFVDYPQLLAHRALLALPYLLTSAGHQAVVIFFVLSGYLISGSIFRMIKRQSWSWPTYVVHRLLRLWIVLIPGLLLCALWDEIGIRFHLAPILYSGGAGNHVVLNVIATHSTKVFFQNLAFLQIVLAPTFGSDGALWSLSYEFWYYILFPIGLFTVLTKTSLRIRIFCACLFAAIAWFVGSTILLSFPIWLAGTVLACVPPPKVSVRVRILVAVLYVPIFFAFARPALLPGVIARMPLLYRDYILTIITFLLLWVFLSATAPVRRSTEEHLIQQTSRFSYTLYVSHTPLCVLLVALLVGDTRWTPDPWHILLALGVLVVLLAYAYGVAVLTEFRTDRVRHWLEDRLGLKRSRSQGMLSSHGVEKTLNG